MSHKILLPLKLRSWNVGQFQSAQRRRYGKPDAIERFKQAKQLDQTDRKLLKHDHDFKPVFGESY